MEPIKRPLNSGEQQLICALADPICGSPEPGEIIRHDADRLFDAAREHYVEPVVVRKLSGVDFSRLDSSVEQALATRLSKSTKDQMFMSAITMALDAQGRRIGEALAALNISHAMVKGASFAQELYPVPSDRPYSDIDILLPKSALASAGAVMATLGFNQFKREHFDRSVANEEQKWGLKDNPLLLVELHTNLVHMRPLRNRVSLGYEEYMIASGDGAHLIAGYFITAVMHAGCGHKFHQLRLLVDVLQAARALDDDDLDHIRTVLPKLRIHPEISMCLALMDELFDDWLKSGGTDKIKAVLDLPYCWMPVDGDAVINAPKLNFRRSKIRRHAFRIYQMTLASPRRPSIHAPR